MITKPDASRNATEVAQEPVIDETRYGDQKRVLPAWRVIRGLTRTRFSKRYYETVIACPDPHGGVFFFDSV